MANVNNPTIKQERIDAYEVIASLFPSASDMARELALDNRATVSQWKSRGVPIEYIMVMDIVGLISKEELIPSVKNWDLMLSKYEQVIQNKLNKILLADSLRKTAASTLQTVLAPIIETQVMATLHRLGLYEEDEPDTIM